MATKAPRNSASKTRDVPANALRMSLGTCQFAAAEGDSKQIPFSMLARSAEPVFNWFFGMVYHDFSGMKHRESIAVDYCHNDHEILGFADKFDVDEEGLHLAGAIVPFTPDDRASEVAHKQKAGIPYEASIDFTGDDVVYEEVREGYVAEVNGKQVAGPALIVREWPLRGVAICPHGMDARTETQFSQTDKKVRVKLLQSTIMAKTATSPAKPASKLSTKAPKPAPASKMAEGDDEEDKKPETEQEEGDDVEEDCDCEGDEDCDCDKGDENDSDSEMEDDEEAKPEQKQARAAVGKELKKFTNRFGVENGTKWFLEGKSLQQATAAHAKHLERQLAAKDAENEKLRKRLTAAKTGEDVPAKFAEDANDSPRDDGKTVNSKFEASLGPNLGKFAAGLKMPKRK